MRRYLVVANQTAAGPALQDAITRLRSRGACSFTLVVPATHPRDQLAWTEGTAYGLARRRLQDALDALRATGAEVDGWVGDADPYRAISDAMLERAFDEVILSTFPQSHSRWRRMDVARRVEEGFRIRVTVVESERLPIRSTG